MVIFARTLSLFLHHNVEHQIATQENESNIADKIQGCLGVPYCVGCKAAAMDVQPPCDIKYQGTQECYH